MAARPALKLAARALGWAAAAIAGAAALILIFAWVGSSLPRNGGWEEPAVGDPEAIEIMIGDNGIHTELVLPLVTREKDWRGTFPATDVVAADAPYTHVAVSWGEREVFLNTPTWSDLTLSTAIRAMIGGDALIHAAHYIRPAPGPDNRPLRLTRAQYARLVTRIEAALPPSGERRRYRGYAEYDVFYAARGRYRWDNTCNQWTSDTLARAGVTTGRWTPFAGGVMKWVEQPG